MEEEWNSYVYFLIDKRKLPGMNFNGYFNVLKAVLWIFCDDMRIKILKG